MARKARSVEPEPPPLAGWPRPGAVEPPAVENALQVESHPLLAPIDDARRRLPLRADAGVAPGLELRTLGP